MGRIPFFEHWMKLTVIFQTWNILEYVYCLQIGIWTRIPYFWLQTNKHSISNLVQPITRFAKLLINKTQTSFLNIRGTLTCSDVDNGTWIPYFWFRRNGHETPFVQDFHFWLYSNVIQILYILHQDTQWMRTRFWFSVFYGKTKSANLFHLIKIKCQLEIGRYPTNGNEILWCFCELWLETSFMEFLISLYCVYFWSE